MRPPASVTQIMVGELLAMLRKRASLSCSSRVMRARSTDSQQRLATSCMSSISSLRLWRGLGAEHTVCIQLLAEQARRRCADLARACYGTHRVFEQQQEGIAGLGALAFSDVLRDAEKACLFRLHVAGEMTLHPYPDDVAAVRIHESVFDVVILFA